MFQIYPIVINLDHPKRASARPVARTARTAHRLAYKPQVSRHAAEQTSNFTSTLAKVSHTAVSTGRKCLTHLGNSQDGYYYIW